jgi:hypothetical protein
MDGEGDERRVPGLCPDRYCEMRFSYLVHTELVKS